MKTLNPDRRSSFDSNNDDDSSSDNDGVMCDNRRGQEVFVRPTGEIGAMAWDRRVATKFKSFFNKNHIKKKKDDDDDDDDMHGRMHGRFGSGNDSSEINGADNGDMDSGRLQYKLEATSRSKGRSYLSRILKRSSDGALGINPNQELAIALHWMFRVNFVLLFIVMCILFFILVIFFAIVIMVIGNWFPSCIMVGEENMLGKSLKELFPGAFALSWTTFSTVGYGSTYPAIGSDSHAKCLVITFWCSLESLVGVLYSGFCGAILFGKVLRIQSHAQVIFSDPIVIRYGSGVSELYEFDDQVTDESGKKKIPFPALEFRIVNRLFSDVGGEIMDATLNVVANVDANDADPTMTDGLSGDSGGLRRSELTVDSTHNQENDADDIKTPEATFDRAGGGRRSSIFDARLVQTIIGKKNSNSIYEDPASRLVSKRIFSKMMIEASEHPFFKRVWLARHILDDNSPILKPRVRKLIRRNNSSWPEHLSTYESIRESLQFNQILVSLNGVSNVSASDVYAQKIYDFVDVNVGYQFVNILYRDTDGILKVDTDLLNDVREQRGGGGEPLIVDE